jgi:hypothetical protein
MNPVLSTHPTSLRSILIVSCHLRVGLPSSFFPSGFPTKPYINSSSAPMHAIFPAHFILLDFIFVITLFGLGTSTSYKNIEPHKFQAFETW